MARRSNNCKAISEFTSCYFEYQLNHTSSCLQIHQIQKSYSRIKQVWQFMLSIRINAILNSVKWENDVKLIHYSAQSRGVQVTWVSWLLFSILLTLVIEENPRFYSATITKNSMYTVFRKKMVHFVFEHNFTTINYFITMFSDSYWVISPQVCHTVKIISGLK